MQGRKAITSRLMARQRPHGWRERVGGKRRKPAAAGAGRRERRSGAIAPGRRRGVEGRLSRDSEPRAQGLQCPVHLRIYRATCESRHLLVFRNPCPMSPKTSSSSQLPGSLTVSQVLRDLTSLTSETLPHIKPHPHSTTTSTKSSIPDWLSRPATYKCPFLKTLLHLRPPPCFHIPN